ncbi:hypothetical protein F5144DRAFT_546815 [Chaetomium tenue]|uniref:Uncharacterized protein n=1 Tax=Chaetomium tenue TaxID=1854479 RepID=A0ACB7PHB8_9PEZI|nr:hypothetical protein F5144DRAFT_546815 [Chaetomium globosum]
MPIVPLPEVTVHNLGSSLVITSPVLLLKELVDNAIDAGATSIDVLVSPNTIDKIEVRDNGHGISPADFGYLGCPGHTSKLRSLDELDTLGGKTLGFRGVALASANTLAKVSLTTRVPTEHVAAAISLAKRGGVDTLRYVGAPVGTAVRVTNLFSHMPVRSQVTAKEAPRNLARMNELLQSYVLARPTVKLRFTVLKTPNLSWSYAPAANGDLKAAAIQLFGTELASQCIFETSPSEMTQGDDKTSGSENVLNCPPKEGTRVIFEALLPRPTADPQKISKGAFISVDARPLSTVRGPAKKLLSIFKKRIGDHFASIHSETTLRNPFIRLNIRCPPRTYDVNVEPSKEDVIFKEEHAIIDQFESFLSYVYPASDVGQSRPLPKTSTETNVEAPGRKSTEISSSSLSLQATSSPWRVDMSSGLDGMSDDEIGDQAIAHTPQHTQQMVEAEVPEGNNEQPLHEGLNPWSIAKLTGKPRNSAPQDQGPVQDTHQEAQPQLTEPSTTDPFSVSSPPNMRESSSRHSPGPQHSPRDRRRNPASQGRRFKDFTGHKQNKSTVISARLSNQQSRSRRYHALQSPPTSSPHDQDRERVVERVVSRDRPRPQNSAGLARITQSQLLFDRNNSRLRLRDNPDLGLNLNQQVSETVRPGMRARNPPLTRLVDVEDADTMMGTFARVNSAGGATVQHISPMSLSRNTVGGDESATEAQLAGKPDESTTQPLLRIDDPRARLIQQQRLATASVRKKPKRLKTGQLPLETIPCDSETCALLLAMAVDASSLAQLLTEASRFDTWLVDGELRGAFEDGTEPKDTARLIEPLLARLAYGTTVNA